MLTPQMIDATVRQAFQVLPYDFNTEAGYANCFLDAFVGQKWSLTGPISLCAAAEDATYAQAIIAAAGALESF